MSHRNNGVDLKKDDRLPPHSEDMERGVLGCILLAPFECMTKVLAKFCGQSPWYDLRNQAIFTTLAMMFNNREAIDVLTVYQRLKDNAELDQVGGIAYLNALQDAAPSAANLSYYLDIVWEKYELRRRIQICTDVVSRIYKHEGEVDVLLDEVDRDLERLTRRDQAADDVFGWDDLVAMDTDNDANCVLGFHQGRTTRYLCKGHAAWLIGPSGIGKSSLLFQAGVCFATGRPFFGINTAFGRKYRVLIVQAENDRGDLAEMAKGIRAGMMNGGASPFDGDDNSEDAIRQRLKVVTCIGKTGQQFCAWLRQQIEHWRAAIVLVDPLLSFAGIDVSRQDQASQFCRLWLDPVLKQTKAVLISAHHTGKPPRDAKKQGPRSISELAYDGIGSSELVNWARAIMLLQTAGENVYRLVMAKRGARAWATHPNGEWTKTLWLEHAKEIIFWEQLEPPAESPSNDQGGRPSKVDELLATGLGPLIDDLTRPISKKELAKKIENYAGKRSMDVSVTTCKRAVEKLVANKAIIKTEEGYVRA